MRRESARHRQNIARKETERQNRNRAAELLRTSTVPNLSAISRETDVDRRLVGRIRDAINNNATKALHKLLNPADYQPGRPRVLSKSEERMLVSRIIYAAKRGFGIDINQIREAMGEMANDGRVNFANTLPSMETVRRFRAQHREITYRTSQQKELAKLLAENPQHAASLKVALESVRADFPDIYDDPNRIWNMDETSIDGSGNVRKIFCASAGSNTGSRVDGDATNGKHVTCVVTTSASGLKIPPFFIIEGSILMKKFFEPLVKPQNLSRIPEGFEKFFERDWCDGEVGFAMSTNGSMTKEVLVAYIDHFNKHVRKIVPSEKHVALILDGHKSRQGIEWIKYGVERSICAVQGAANTTHYLQPADQYINRVLKRAARAFHDALSAYTHSTATVQFKIMKAVYGYSKIEVLDVQKSWAKTGLYPMDYRFVGIAEQMWAGRDTRVTEETVGFIDLTVAVRESDTSIVERIQKIVESQSIASSEKVQKITMLTANAASANNILQNTGAVHRTSQNARVGNGVEGPNFGVVPSAVKAGQSAVYLSKKEAMEAMESKAKALEDERKRKAERKRVREEKRAAKKVLSVGAQK